MRDTAGRVYLDIDRDLNLGRRWKVILTFEFHQYCYVLG